MTDLSKRIEDIEIIESNPITNSAYIRPFSVKYKQDGVVKHWDYTIVHNSVLIILYDTSSDSLIFVKQFRPAVYMTDYENWKNGDQKEPQPPFSNGVTIELCAGIIDRKDNPENIAASEVLEETGYKVSPQNLEFVLKFRGNVGTAGSSHILYYTEVNDSLKVEEGGGIKHEGEMIELVKIKVSEVEHYLNEGGFVNSPSGVSYAVLWFLNNKRLVAK